MSDDFNKALDKELSRGDDLHGDFTSFHQAIAVIREEYLEVEAEVFKKVVNYEALETELIQLAAMCKKMYRYSKAQTEGYVGVDYGE